MPRARWENSSSSPTYPIPQSLPQPERRGAEKDIARGPEAYKNLSAAGHAGAENAFFISQLNAGGEGALAIAGLRLRTDDGHCAVPGALRIAVQLNGGMLPKAQKGRVPLRDGDVDDSGREIQNLRKRCAGVEMFAGGILQSWRNHNA